MNDDMTKAPPDEGRGAGVPLRRARLSPAARPVVVRRSPDALSQIRCQDGAVTKAEKFVNTLHVIAAASGNTAAVDEVFQRFLLELKQQLGPERIRRHVEDLQNTLAAETTPPPTGRFADLRNHARGIVAAWLRDY